MNVSEAFAILGLSEGASGDEIAARFRVLAHDAHPDGCGDINAWSRLEAAYQVARESVEAATASTPTALVASRVAQTPLQVQSRYSAELLRLELQSRVRENVVPQIVRAHTGRLKTLKRLSGLISAAAAAITTLATFALGSVSATVHEFPGVVQLAALALSLEAGGVYVYLWWNIENLSNGIEDISDTLDDKQSLLDLLHEILGETRISEGSVTSSDLKQAVSSWAGDQRQSGRERVGLFGGSRSIKLLAARIGPDDFAKLLIEKSKASNLVRERVRVIASRPVVLYELYLADNEQSATASSP